MHNCRAARLLTTVALAAAAGVASAQSPEAASPAPRLPPDWVYLMDGSLERVRQEFAIPGLAVGVVEDGVPVYVRAFGMRDTQTDAPVTLHTLFHVASISKTLTAAAVMQLAERNRLALTDPIGRHLPAFAASPITVSQLLTHTAGLQDIQHASTTTDAGAVGDYVTKVAQRKLAYAPGQGWEYSDAAFNVLGAAIEAVSEQSYSQYMQAHVLSAAGMVESTFEPPGTDDDIAWPHTGEFFVRRASRYPWDRALLPSAGLNASITDMMRWAAAHLNRDPALLSPASYDALLSRRLDSGWEGMAMGLGWQLEERGDLWLPRHAGSEHGFSALLTLYPEQRRAIIILSNGETTPRGAIRRMIEAALAGEAIVYPSRPLLQRSDFQWVLGGLAGLVAMLIAVTMRFRRRRFS
jgi:CubicO group peptidase (beta-lactamase class C family)